MSNKLFATIAVVLVVALIGGGAIIFIASSGRNKTATTTKKTTDKNAKTTLTIWRAFDDDLAFSRLIESYQENNPNVTIKYVKKDLADYEAQSLNALAAGTGPDLWSIKNDWMSKHRDKLIPMPDNFFVNPKKNEARDNATLYKDVWAPVTTSTNIADNKVYGVPLSVDTLVLYVNLDLWGEARKAYRNANAENINFDDALFRNSPATWNDLEGELKYLTKKDAKGNLTQSGIALGTSNNVPNSADILSLLMLQNGATMVDSIGKAARFNAFDNGPDNKPVYKGTKALEFYTSFADSANSNYSWNGGQANALDQFVSGKLPMMIGWQFMNDIIKQRAPTLNFDVASVPQVKGSPEVNYASFWTETVTNNSRNSEAAWDFLATIALRPNSYLSATKRSTALLEDVKANQKSDIYAKQTLTAKTWNKGKSFEAVDIIFNDLINNVSGNHQPAQTSIDSAATKVTELLQKE